MAKPAPASLIEYPVVESRQVGAYRLISFVAREIAESAIPGQFLMVRQSGPSLDPLLPRPLGIHDIDADLVRILIEPVGKGTDDLARLRVGDRLSVLGPLGNGFDSGGGGMALLVGGGIGVAPLALLARSLTASGRDVHCLLGFRTRSQAVSAELFRDYLVEVFTEDASVGTRGLVSEPLSAYLSGNVGMKDKQAVEVFACGPDPMLREVARIASENGVRAQVSAAAHMACGIGACQGCVVRTTRGYQRACSEGPVFEAGELLW
ncbi:MAG: dihydroorotate dehydrogenase electron transfer subunit [Thermoleophilia bacterium]